jgi:integrase
MFYTVHLEHVSSSLSIILSGKRALNPELIFSSIIGTPFMFGYRNEDISKVPPFSELSFNLPEIEYLELEEQEDVLKYIPVRHRPIFQIGMEYGYRTQEVRGLKKDCVDLKKGIITIRRSFSDNTLRDTTKTHLVRYDPITTYTREVLGKGVKSILDLSMR